MENESFDQIVFKAERKTRSEYTVNDMVRLNGGYLLKQYEKDEAAEFVSTLEAMLRYLRNLTRQQEFKFVLGLNWDANFMDGATVRSLEQAKAFIFGERERRLAAREATIAGSEYSPEFLELLNKKIGRGRGTDMGTFEELLSNAVERYRRALNDKSNHERMLRQIQQEVIPARLADITRYKESLIAEEAHIEALQAVKETDVPTFLKCVETLRGAGFLVLHKPTFFRDTTTKVLLVTPRINVAYFVPSAGIDRSYDGGHWLIKLDVSVATARVDDVRAYPLIDFVKTESVTHPHVYGGSICWGNGEWHTRLDGFGDVLMGLLNKYSPSNPYRQFSYFNRNKNNRRLFPASDGLRHIYAMVETVASCMRQGHNDNEKEGVALLAGRLAQEIGRLNQLVVAATNSGREWSEAAKADSGQRIALLGVELYEVTQATNNLLGGQNDEEKEETDAEQQVPF